MITSNVFSFINVNSINHLLFQQKKYSTSLSSQRLVKTGTFKTKRRFLT
jgi:hypothetical protein